MKERRKTRILFISKHVVHDKVAMAGNQLFNYYLTRFCSDSAFDVGYLIVHKNDSSYQQMHEKFRDNAQDFSIFLPKILRLFTYAYYNSFLRLLFSCLRPDWYYLDPVYAWYHRRGLRKIKAAGWEPDVVVFEWTEMLFLLPYYTRLFPSSYRIATEHDVCFVKLGRQYGKNKILKLLFLPAFRKRELSLIDRLNLVLVLSADDKTRLKDCGIHPDKIMLLSPYYSRRNQSQLSVKPEVVFFGAMNRAENQEAVNWFVNKVFLPFNLSSQLRFVIMGAGLPSKMKEDLERHRNIICTGFVEKPEEYFETALCMVVPLLFGGGIKIKVLEAMSCGVPVLTNQIGIEGIGANPGIDYLHCESPEDYRDGLISLLEDRDLARHIGEKGRKLMENRFSYENSYLDYRGNILHSVGTVQTLINN